MPDPNKTWAKMGAYLTNLVGAGPMPAAVVVVSAHWETKGEPTVGSGRYCELLLPPTSRTPFNPRSEGIFARR